MPYVLLSIVPTAACAWLSWHVVEKRAMAFKDRGPGRGASTRTFALAGRKRLR